MAYAGLVFVAPSISEPHLDEINKGRLIFRIPRFRKAQERCNSTRHVQGCSRSAPTPTTQLLDAATRKIATYGADTSPDMLLWTSELPIITRP